MYKKKNAVKVFHQSLQTLIGAEFIVHTAKESPENHKRVLKRHLERATAISMIDQDKKTGAQSLTC